MWHFEIRGDYILAINSILENSVFSNTEIWGCRIGGRWCLDYTFKITFGISDKDWNEKCEHLTTNDDFYNLCEWLGIRYKRNGHIYHYNQIVEK